MKIRSIKIKDIGGVREAEIDFHPRMNVICGPNGIGKTTILDSVAHSFSNYGSNTIKRNALSERGIISIDLDDRSNSKNNNIEVTTFKPSDRTYANGLKDFAHKVINIKTQRLFSYTSLESITRDQVKSEQLISTNLELGVDIGDMKNWLANRVLFSNTPNAFSISILSNLELSKRCFSLLDKDYSFRLVDATTFDIMVDTPSGPIWYEYLSSGFKSCLSMMFAIIKEIESRMPKEHCLASEFDGVVLIDELEIHLHPEWQTKIASVLTQTFPATQFIITTHSPHIVQNAEPDQIIALGKDEHGVTIVRTLPHNKYGYAGWTLDEVLKDVMGMEDTRSARLRELMAVFDKAIEEEKPEEAKAAYDELDKALHPENIARKLLKFDLLSVTAGAEDAK